MVMAMAMAMAMTVAVAVTMIVSVVFACQKGFHTRRRRLTVQDGDHQDIQS